MLKDRLQIKGGSCGIALDTMIVGVFWSKLGTTGVIFLRGRLFAQDGFGSNAACHGVWTLNVIQLSEVL
jgi:hypothetical protein